MKTSTNTIPIQVQFGVRCPIHNKKTGLKMHRIRIRMHLLMSDSVPARFIGQALGSQFGNHMSKRGQLQEIFFHTVQEEWFTPSTKMSSLGYQKMFTFRCPWKGSTQLSFCIAKHVLTSPNQAFTLRLQQNCRVTAWTKWEVMADSGSSGSSSASERLEGVKAEFTPPQPHLRVSS